MDKPKPYKLLLGIIAVILYYSVSFFVTLTTARSFLNNHEDAPRAVLAKAYDEIRLKQEDVDLYYRYSQTIKAGYLPYRDFPVEYPAGGIICIILPSMLTNDPLVFQLLFNLEMAGFCILTAFTIWNFIKDSKPGRLSTYQKIFVFSLLLCGTVLVARFDAAAAFFLVSATYFSLKEKPALSGFIAGFGFAVKLFPVIALIPYGVYLVYNIGRKWRDILRCGISFCFAVAVVLLPSYLVSNQGFLDSFDYHSERGLQIESILGTHLWLDYSLTEIAPTEFSFGSVNFVSDRADSIADMSLNILVVAGGGGRFRPPPPTGSTHPKTTKRPSTSPH